MRCYLTLLVYLPEERSAAPARDIKGLLSGFEVAAQADHRLRDDKGLIPEVVKADCDYVKGAILRAGARLGIKALVPGGGLIDLR